MESLIELGADVDKADDYGWTPLHAACEKVNFRMIKILVDHGANINNASSKDGWTPLRSAVQTCLLFIVKSTISGQDDAKEMTVYERHLEIIKYLINHGADMNKGDDVGTTPLHAAAHIGHLHAVKYLTSKGADFDRRDSDGDLPLDIANKEGFVDIVIYLKSLGKTHVIFPWLRQKI